MSQSTFKWVVTLEDCTTYTVISTPDNLPNVVDFSMGIVSIVRVEFI